MPRIPCRPASALAAALAALATTATAADQAAPVDELAALRAANQALGARLDALERRQVPPPAAAGPGIRLVDLSLDILTAAGGSTASDAELADLQGGGHDPHRRGFTFQGAELSLAGAVDPFFIAEAHLVAVREEPSGETGIELEEAFARSTGLPAGLEAKAGLFLMEFGRFNPTHPHAWQFIDQPIILSRVFGGDGQRTPGARLAWSLPTPWLSELLVGAMDANGETAPSFLSNDEGGTVGGRPFAEQGTRSPASLVWNARLSNAVDVGDGIAKLGLSAATGPNAAGGDTRTGLWGIDGAYRWHPAGGERGWPFILIEAEFLERAYETPEAALIDGLGNEVGTVGRGTLRDRGFVAQLVYGFHPGWAAGVRGEYASGRGRDLVTGEDGSVSLAGRADDPYRDDRTRLSALLSWQPSEFTHFRLQYNYDRAGHLDDAAHTVWLGAEFLIGSHPAHVF